MLLRNANKVSQIFGIFILLTTVTNSGYCSTEQNMENMANAIVQGYRNGIYSSVEKSFLTFQQRFENTKKLPSVDIRIPLNDSLAKFEKSHETNGFCMGSPESSECVIFSFYECKKEIDELTITSNCEGNVYGKEGISYPVKLAKDLLSDENTHFYGNDDSTEFVLQQTSEFMIKHGVLLSSTNGRPEALVNEDGSLINSKIGYSGYDINQHLANSDGCVIVALEATSEREIIRSLNSICRDNTELETLQISRKNNEYMFAKYSSERIPGFFESTWNKLSIE